MLNRDSFKVSRLSRTYNTINPHPQPLRTPNKGGAEFPKSRFFGRTRAVTLIISTLSDEKHVVLCSDIETIITLAFPGGTTAAGSLCHMRVKKTIGVTMTLLR